MQLYNYYALNLNSLVEMIIALAEQNGTLRTDCKLSVLCSATIFKGGVRLLIDRPNLDARVVVACTNLARC